MSILLGALALSALTACPSMLKRPSTASRETSAAAFPRAPARAAASERSRVCSILKEYPKPAGEKLAFEAGRIGDLCRPFVRGARASLDRCGEVGADPYTLVSGETRSRSTWPTRNQMYSKGKVNLLADPAHQARLPRLYRRIEEIRAAAAETCCGGEPACKAAMSRVEVSICQPKDDPDASDPCAFGGTFEMAGRNYAAIFGGLSRMYRSDDTLELGAIAARNLGAAGPGRSPAEAGAGGFTPLGGRIVLTSYVPRSHGARALEPTLHHEFGHACSMIRMQAAAAGAAENRAKALRAVNWLDQVKRRCDIGAESPEAYYDFWEAMGESRALASCLSRLTELNRTGEIDKPCEGVCPGHYLEETVGVAFSMLNGDIGGRPESVYPNTCDHMRDRQHPMVSDVVECLAQNSPRFRERVASAYGCGDALASAD